ncbi:condensation domain-containing protein, partial [Actinoplanes philippinensis]|uniref:condensation domain-containing protein n=1 Tax=Actinoplanes philippinensis TaxID=35752 RepID=UPI0033E2460A
ALAAAISNRFDVELNPATVLRAPSLAGLVDGLTSRAPLDLSHTGQDFIPLTAMQASFYLANQFVPDSDAFHCPLVWRLTRPVNPALLRLALHDLSRRHPLLRGILDYRQDEIGLRVLPAPQDRLTTLAAPGEEQAHQLLDQQVRRPLLTGHDEPLWRAVLITYPCRGVMHTLVGLVNHHMLVDWTSAQILLGDLSRYYRTRETGEYPAVRVTPAWHALAERRRRDAVVAPASRDYWRTRLAGLPPVIPIAGDASRHHRVLLPEPSVAGLRRWARAVPTTLHNVVLGCFLAAYHDWSGRDDVTVGVSYGFPRTGYAGNVCAPLLNTLCIRSRRPGAGSLADDLYHLSQQVLDAMEHSDVPTARMAPDVRGRPPFEASFSYQENTAPELDLGVPAEPVTVAVTPMFPVVVAAAPCPGGIRLDVTSRLSAAAPGIDGLIARFVETAGRLAVADSVRGSA